MGFLLIPLVAPYDQNLLSGLSFDSVGRALRPISDFSIPKMQLARQLFHCLNLTYSTHQISITFGLLFRFNSCDNLNRYSQFV